MNKPVRIEETKTVHGAIDFPENSMLIGFRIYEADSDGELKPKTVCLSNDGHKWQRWGGFRKTCADLLG